ncbi:phage portal protein [Escherichia coli]|nr:phage portal protein [Escherichia coli]
MSLVFLQNSQATTAIDIHRRFGGVFFGNFPAVTGKQISSQRAMRLTAVFSCVRVLAESVGMLPCNLYHLNGSLKQRATGERLHKLISTHPNGYMTPQEFWELVVTCLCLRGNFYAYKVKAFGEVAELLPVDPGCVVFTQRPTYPLVSPKPRF